MDRATLIDMAQTWLRLAQEEEQEANRSDVVGRSEVVQQQINKKDSAASTAAIARSGSTWVGSAFEKSGAESPTAHSQGTFGLRVPLSPATTLMQASGR